MKPRLSAGPRGKRGVLLPALAVAAFAAAVLFYFSNIMRSAADMPVKAAAFAYLAAALLAGGALVLCCFAVSRREIKPEKLFTAFMLTAGIAYAAVFLPFTVPDEPGHYLSAYRLSNYLTFNFDQFGEERLLIRSADLDFFAKLRDTRLSPEYYANVANGFEMFVSGKEAAFIPAEFLTTAPAGYVASAIGISLGRMLRLGAVPTFYLGRIANLAVYVLAIRLAIKRVPYGKAALFAIASLPMAIQLSASYSYDSLVIALAILFVAQVLSMREKDGKATVGDIALCAICAALLAQSKLVYFPLVFAVLFIPPEKFPGGRKYSAHIKAGVILFAGAALLATHFVAVSSAAVGGKCTWTDGRLYSVGDIFARPLSFMRVLMRTLATKTDFYFASMTSSYMGWHQLVIPVFAWLPALALLGFSFLPKKNETPQSLTARQRAGAFIALFASAALIMLSMLLTWTPTTSDVIEGVQGRYFIPLLPLLFAAARSRRVSRPENSDRFILLTSVYYAVFMLFVYFGMVF